MDYAMSVIISRALPDVRDGIKPVHRRILYAMWDTGVGSTAKLRKSAYVVGEVLGKYHPHGDVAVYDSLVRMAQSFALRYPLIQGQGNFGSIDGDSAAAMRYCVSGDTLITTEKGLMPIREISPNNKEDIKLKILSKDRNINIASKWFDSGEHPTIEITTKSGLSLRGSCNHPILVCAKNQITGQPNFTWKLLSQVEKGDYAVVDRTPDVLWPEKRVCLEKYWPNHFTRRTEKKALPEELDENLAFILGALISEGTIKQNKIEFCNSDKEFIEQFENKWQNVFPDCRLHKFFRQPNSFGKKSYYILEVHSRYVIEFLRNIGLAPVKSAKRLMPALILQSPKDVAASFLRACFEGDGSISYSGKMTELSYISTSEDLVKQIQIFLLRFDIASAKRFDRWRDTHKIYIRGLRNYLMFEEQIGFVCNAKREKFNKSISRLRKDYSQNDFVPFFSDFVRAAINRDNDFYSREFVLKNNFDRYSNMGKNYSRILTAIRPRLKNEIQHIFEKLLLNNYLFDPIVKKENCGKEIVYSLRVDSDCHSFVGNGFVNHNTECRLNHLAEEMLIDIDKETVNWVDNYDGTRQEPVVLPAKLPQLLINGSVGIAVGMATNIPPHNLTEVVDAAIHLINDPEATAEELCEFVKGPDFPTGGYIYDQKAIVSAYSQGKGAIVNRAKTEITENKKGHYHIIITEIPYQVNKATLLERIAELVKDKKIEGIKDIRDESDKDGLRIAIDVKTDASPQKILNQLFKLKDLQKSFHMNMLALVDGVQPQILSLKNLLEQYLVHRYHIVTRRTKYDLKKAKERAHILEGLKTALDHIDAVISTIRKSDSKENAKDNLIKKFKLTEVQALAILAMPLSSLAKLERNKIEDELKEKKKLMKELEDILKSPKKIQKVIEGELIEVKNKYGDERRTKVFKGPVGEFAEEDLIPEEESIITLTADGYIKRMSPKVYRAQHRGGKGVTGITTRDEDDVKYFISASSHDSLLFFTNTGRVFRARAYEIPVGSRTARGQAIVNILQLTPQEKVTAMLPLKKGEGGAGKKKGAVVEKKEGYLVMATHSAIIKKTSIADFDNVRRSGLIAIKLQKGDELGWARLTSGKDEIMLSSQGGQVIRFKEKDLRPMGRAAAGVRGMRLKKGDLLVGMDIIREADGKVLVVTENGYGKTTELKHFKAQKRGGSGVKIAKVTPKTGKIVSIQVLAKELEDLIAISSKGQVIRTPLKAIPNLGRATQGVRIMKVEKGDKVASVTCV